MDGFFLHGGDGIVVLLLGYIAGRVGGRVVSAGRRKGWWWWGFDVAGSWAPSKVVGQLYSGTNFEMLEML